MQSDECGRRSFGRTRWSHRGRVVSGRCRSSRYGQGFSSNSGRHRQRMRFKREIIRAILVALVVTLIWCWVFHRFTAADWKVPNDYTGDSLFTLAWTKAASDGEFLPIISKTNRYLNAPFIANWNDFPLSEDM